MTDKNDIPELRIPGLTIDESFHFRSVCVEFNRTLVLLQKYDNREINDDDHGETSKEQEIWYPKPEAVNAAIQHLKEHIHNSGQNVDSFGVPRDESNDVHNAFEQIRQEFEEREAYPGLPSKAAHLMYFITKKHYFVDGNKRIAAALMLWFMDMNDMLVMVDESSAVDSGKYDQTIRTLQFNLIYGLMVFIAKSETADRKIVIDLVTSIIETHRLSKDNVGE